MQNYIDVRQNGSIIKQFANGELDGSNAPYVNDYDMALDLSKSYLPAVFVGSGDFLKSPFTKSDYQNGITTVGYTNLFFTTQIDGVTPDIATAAPKLQDAIFGNLAGDADVELPYKPIDEDAIGWQWYRAFYKTQGKISEISFRDFYFKSIGLKPDNNEKIEKQRKYLDDNGPAVYYKKASSGVRLCLVIPAEQNSDLKDLYNSLAGTGADIKSREIYKEKFGLYKNELDEEFIVIPLIMDETDYLQDQQSLWKGQKDVNDSGLEPQPLPRWWRNIYNNLRNHDFGTNAENILNEFNNLYPVTSNFAQALPITVQSLIDLEYSDQLSTMFDLTKEEILRAIRMLKAVIEGEWDLNANDMVVPGMDMYAALAFSLIPILIKLLATFVDPTWKTPWFFPGPTNPVGFAAKILDAAD